MRHPKLLRQLFLGCVACFAGFASQAQAPADWFTPAVAKKLGVETCCGHVPNYDFKTQQFGKGRVSVARIAVFDTIATYAQGRLVNFKTHQSIKDATIQVKYCDAFSGVLQKKSVTTDANGIFRLGWVGYSGPRGPKHPRLVMVKAKGYETTEAAVSFGGSAYLHIELAVAKRKP